MYLEIDLHKRYAQVAIINSEGQIVEEARVTSADPDDLARHYAGSRAVIKTISNYYHVYGTLAEYLDVIVAHPSKLTLIAHSDKKTDRVDAKELARLPRLNSVPQSYVPTDEIR